MATHNFERIMEIIFRSEGGYVDHAKDPGGATNMGITIGTLREYRGHDVSKADVRALTKAEAREIYRDRYWDPIRGDDLPSGLDLAVMDFAVNSGPSRAARYLQAIVGVPQDGKIGPVTLAAVRRGDVAALINGLCDARMKFLKGLGTFATFGKGWTSRVAGVRKDALLIAVSPAPPIPDVPTYPEAPATNPAKASPKALIIFIALALVVAAIAYFTMR